MSLTREDLEPMGCSNPICTHDHSVLFLHGKCHPNAGVEAAYVKNTGVLTVRCQRCKMLVVELQIARRLLQ